MSLDQLAHDWRCVCGETRHTAERVDNPKCPWHHPPADVPLEAHVEDSIAPMRVVDLYREEDMPGGPTQGDVAAVAQSCVELAGTFGDGGVSMKSGDGGNEAGAMGYVLDGIKTALVQTQVWSVGGLVPTFAYACPCGWESDGAERGALRFHYAHCAKAKLSSRMFPIQDGPDIPWEEAERYYEEYARQHGRSQSMERIAERGGFYTRELELLEREHQTHFIEQCVHGTVVNQCRCIGPHKKVLTAACPPHCQGPTT